jgi:intein-encoded DNA endonuclease-like protein
MEGPAPTRPDAKSANKDSEKGRRRPALDTRILLHEKVLILRKNSQTFQRIIDKIEQEHGVRLTKSTISNWTRGKSSPLRAGHAFVPKPTPDLAYVIGVETGDAFLNVKLRSYQYRIRLRAVDREFVEAFNQAVSRFLDVRLIAYGRAPPRKKSTSSLEATSCTDSCSKSRRTSRS